MKQINSCWSFTLFKKLNCSLPNQLSSLVHDFFSSYSFSLFQHDLFCGKNPSFILLLYFKIILYEAAFLYIAVRNSIHSHVFYVPLLLFLRKSALSLRIVSLFLLSLHSIKINYGAILLLYLSSMIRFSLSFGINISNIQVNTRYGPKHQIHCPYS